MKLTSAEKTRRVLEALSRETEYLPAQDLLARDRRHDHPLMPQATPAQVGARCGMLVRAGHAARRVEAGLSRYRITQAGWAKLGHTGLMPPTMGTSAAADAAMRERIAGRVAARTVHTELDTKRGKIVTIYDVPGTTLRVAVNDRGVTGIGLAELRPDDEHYYPVEPDALMGVLEQARVESHRIAAARVPPPERPLRKPLLHRLSYTPEGASTAVLADGLASFNEVHSELLRLRNDGEVHRVPRSNRWRLAG